MAETTHRVRGLVVTLTERCNLRCDYCYVPVGRGRSMAPETAARAAEWFVANAATEGPLTLSFFGGEPMLATEELRRTAGRVRAGLAGRTVRVTVPTNGLLLSPEVLAWCRREDIELAISIDGKAGTPGRNHAAGGSCAGQVVETVSRVLPRLPPSAVLARMTVTPANVGSLSANVRALARMGFARVVYVADDGARWDEAAVGLWRREHQRMARWLARAALAGKPVPDLPAWRAIRARLLHGAPRRRCGAGLGGVTVTPDGALFPCYRFAYARAAESWRLGDVARGLTRPERLSQLRSLDPSRLRPERGPCVACPAADGCTHFCPALGFIARGDLGAVPDVACRLMQAQVESVRELGAQRAQPGERAAATARTLAAAAAMVVAMGGVASCRLFPSYAARTDAGDAGRAADAAIVPYLKLDAAPDRAQVADASVGEAAAAVDRDRLDTADPYAGGYCPPYMGGYCP